jgi:hypothetical protein
MLISNSYGVSAAVASRRAESLRACPQDFAGITQPTHDAAYAGMTAHAARAVAAVLPQRKRRTAETTDPSVNRGFL